MNEKDQILKSLLRYRLYWIDEFLKWDPADFEGLSSIRLPATSLWVPDVVVYEEAGVMDYKPRIPYVEIRNDGLVRFLQPVAYETTCSVNIEYFPFDQQKCSLTFTSWTFPTSSLDLMSKRPVEKMWGDIALYYIATGEWLLDTITAIKSSQSFAAVLPDANGSTAEEKQFVYMDPQLPVSEVYPTRIKEVHWSDVKFTMTLRRNSSLYMQSMVFPAILLTTISLFGFYLPPDSGERIGLQITIMLTFMVFLLTVGGMFPASTGPYLGIYFVLCMALLAINILMTVLVLHLHHMPCESTEVEAEGKRIHRFKLKVIPSWIRLCLYMTRKHGELSDFSMKEEVIQQPSPTPSKKEPDVEETPKTVTRELPLSATALSHDNEAYEHDYISVDTVQIRNRHKSAWRMGDAALSNEDNGEAMSSRSDRGGSSAQRHGLLSSEVFAEITDALESMNESIRCITRYLSFHNRGLKENKLSEAMQDKWKSLARDVDLICLRVYVVLLLLFHLGIIVAIVASQSRKK